MTLTLTSRYALVRVSPRRFAVIQFVGDGDPGYANGPFEHWRIVNKKCSEPEAKTMLRELNAIRVGIKKPETAEATTA